MTLENHLRVTLEEGWDEAIPEDWRETFGNVRPAFNSPSRTPLVNGEFTPAYPPLEMNANGPHLFRAFRGLAPNQVRVVVVGQDPYPNQLSATGRSFEDWNDQADEFPVSLKRLLQSALTCMQPALRADANDAGWNDVVDEVTGLLTNRVDMTRYFDGLAAQGVMLINAAWTFTEVEDHQDPKVTKRRRRQAQRTHQALWRPVMQRLIEQLAALDQPTVFLLLGEPAQNLLSGINGQWKKAAIVSNPHPAREKYFTRLNPLLRANQDLEVLEVQGGPRITWWPPMQNLPGEGA
jgi:uracil-DNA glycosylase